MTDRPEFAGYLESIAATYAQWWKSHAFMDEIDELTWFEFELDSKTQDKPPQPGEEPQEKTQLVLEAIADYAHEKILIVVSGLAILQELASVLQCRKIHISPS